MRLIVKDPDSVEPRGFDWTDWLAELGSGVTITASTFTLTGGPDAVLTLSNPSIVTGGFKTQVQLNAGTVGGRYTVTNHITTSTSMQDDRSFVVYVSQR